MGWEETLAGTEAAVVFADAVERVGDGMGSGDERERGEKVGVMNTTRCHDYPHTHRAR